MLSPLLGGQWVLKTLSAGSPAATAGQLFGGMFVRCLGGPRKFKASLGSFGSQRAKGVAGAVLPSLDCTFSSSFRGGVLSPGGLGGFASTRVLPCRVCVNHFRMRCPQVGR